LALYKYIRRRDPEHLRIYLINDNLVLYWTPKIRQWAEPARQYFSRSLAATGASVTWSSA
jgi:hypothetical protein